MRGNGLAAFSGGAAIGTLGGLIGLGGAEFRLPLLMGPFRFAALDAVILNKAMSLLVVAAALIFRAGAVPVQAIAAHWDVILNLLAGSLVGAWMGAGWALRLGSVALHRVIAFLLVAIAMALLFGHPAAASGPALTGLALLLAGLVAGLAIGVVASLLGVAGGELLIPTLVLLFGLDLKLAGSVSLAVSLPTMLVGFGRYARTTNAAVLVRYPMFVAIMAVGSLVGALAGGLLVGLVPATMLLPALAALLVLSAIRIWRHRQPQASGGPRARYYSTPNTTH